MYVSASARMCECGAVAQQRTRQLMLLFFFVASLYCTDRQTHTPIHTRAHAPGNIYSMECQGSFKVWFACCSNELLIRDQHLAVRVCAVCLRNVRLLECRNVTLSLSTMRPSAKLVCGLLLHFNVSHFKMIYDCTDSSSIVRSICPI